MDLLFAPRFTRQYRKLARGQQEAVDGAIGLFQQDPFAAPLRNHALKGKLTGLRSIKAGYDLRLVYEETDGHLTVLFLTVGTHDDVY